MRKSLPAIAALAATPLLLTSIPAAAFPITITTDQVTSAIGGAALGVVGGPVGGFVGGVLGKELGKTIERRRRGLDLTRPKGQPVQPIRARIIRPGGNDRVVDSTPMRVLDSGPPMTADRSLAPQAPARPDAPEAGVALAASPDAGAPPGTLDYQLNRIIARDPGLRARLTPVANRG